MAQMERWLAMGVNRYKTAARAGVDQVHEYATWLSEDTRF